MTHVSSIISLLSSSHFQNFPTRHRNYQFSNFPLLVAMINEQKCIGRFAQMIKLNSDCTETRRSEANDASFRDFFILHLPHPSFLPIPPSSPSLLPPRPSCLLIPPSSSILFFPHPALSKSFGIHKSLFFLDFDKSITDQPTNQPTNRPTNGLMDKAAHRDADAS